MFELLQHIYIFTHIYILKLYIYIHVFLYIVVVYKMIIYQVRKAITHNLKGY